MSLREYVGLSEDGANWTVGLLSAGIAVALIASAIGWPVAYYETNKIRHMTENGYEEDGRGNVVKVRN